jgi:hypothetical protein
MWERMLDRVADYNLGRVELGALVADLRGFFVEADPHNSALRSDFETYWAPIDAEHELRTEPWAPPNSANDDTLALSVARFREWVRDEVLADTSTKHD